MWRLIIILAPFITPSAQADDNWEALDRHVEKPLCEAFVDGKAYTFAYQNCTKLGCDKYQYVVKTFCNNTEGAKVATIEHHNSSGGSASSQKITESDWQAHRGNLLRYKAKFAESFGNTFTLDSATNQNANLRATYTIRARNGKVLEQGHWLFTQGPAIPQVQERYAKKFGILDEEITQTLSP